MDSGRQIAVIAPEKMAGAFSVLIHSAPNHSLLASCSGLDELRVTLGEKEPDVILIYLAHESESYGRKVSYEEIAQTKTTWPDAMCITIVKYASQLDTAKENGADLALVDGVDARRLLTALEGKDR